MKNFTMSRKTLRSNWNGSKLGNTSLHGALLILSFLMLSVSSSWAQECTSAQVDDLFTINVDGQPGDWNYLDQNPQVTYSHISDPWGSGVVDNQFTQGSKDPYEIEDLRWANGQTKNKNDIANAAGFLQSVECNGVTYTRLFFAGDRLSTNGTSQIGMWFYQGGVAPIEGTNLFEGEHVEGDILALINFTGGGANAQVEIYSWNADGDGAYGGGNLDFLGTEQHRAVQIQIGENVPENWDFPELNGEKRYDVNQFFEGYINLNAFGNTDLSSCFNRFLIEGRSSQTLTAALDDFASGELNIKPTVTVNSAAICEGETATLTAVPGSGSVDDFNYHWTGPEGVINENDASIDVTQEGTYTVSISYKVLNIDCQSELASGSVTIYDLPEIVVDSSDVTCYDAGDGSVLVPENDFDLILYRSATEDGDFQEVQDPSVDDDGNFIGLGPGWYYVKATASNPQGDGEDPVECSADSNKVQIIQPQMIILSVEDDAILCNGDADGNISGSVSGGTAPYTVLLSGDATDSQVVSLDGGSFDFDGLDGGSYTVTVQDANYSEEGGSGCSASDNAEISEPDALVLVVNGDAILCFGDADGNISGSISGGTAPYNVILSGDADDSVVVSSEGGEFDFDGLDGGSYTITVRDANYSEEGGSGCSASDNAEISEPEILEATASATAETCDYNDGTVTVVVTGGTPPYSYIWDDPSEQTSETATGLAAGIYTVTVTDSNGCEAQASAEVIAPVCDMEACTLGYWKEHTDRWGCYYTCTLYSEVFGIDFSIYSGNPDHADLTLLEALNLGGGGIYNLARQSVAALLNECHDDVSYPYSGDLIQDVYDAFVGGYAGALAGELDMINNTYDCPMGGSSATSADTCPNGTSDPGSEILSNEAVAKGNIILSPNPFRDVLTITFDFDYTSDVSVDVYAGTTLVKNIIAKNVSKGASTQIDLSSYPSQMFIVRVSTSREVISKQVSKN